MQPMFGPAFPLTHEDVLQLYREYIFEGETDEDVFTWAPVRDGMSYFFYGTKAFQHKPGDYGKARLRVDNQSYSPMTTPPIELAEILEDLKARKRALFRDLVTESFACCNDFKRCSAAGACIHPEDRFYNGCFYRKNLEAGLNFYRED